MKEKNKKIYIIGAGKVGTAFIYKLFEKKYNIQFVTDRRIKNKRNLSKDLKNKKIQLSSEIESTFINEAEIIFVIVQDAYLKKTIDEIRNFRIHLDTKIFVHCSGSLTSKIFGERGLKGSFVSLHPIQTFNGPSKSGELLENIYFGIEGEKSTLVIFKKMIKNFNSKSLIIKAEKKYLYHTASVISSNFLVTLLFAVSKIIKEIGYDEKKTFKIYEPIILNTLNNIKRNGIVNSLTGPFDRNDTEIINKHIKELLSANKKISSLYLNFGMLAAELAEQKRSISKKENIKLQQLMNKYLRS